MKTNILWTSEKGTRVVGTISGRNPTLSMLPPALMAKFSDRLSLGETPQPSIAEFTDSDGGIYGVRFFNVYPATNGAMLVSPTSQFVWETKFATAKDFRNEGAVRGHIGFHAAWPESLANWAESYVDHHTTQVKALVKGYGDLVQGTMGWRSERLEIIQLRCNDQDKAGQLAERYDVPVQFGNISQGVAEASTVEWIPEFQVLLDTWFDQPKRKRISSKNQKYSGF